MVRNIVGALLEAGKGNLSTEEVRALVEGKPTQRSPGSTAPSKGLFLMGVEYPP